MQDLPEADGFVSTSSWCDDGYHAYCEAHLEEIEPCDCRCHPAAQAAWRRWLIRHGRPHDERMAWDHDAEEGGRMYLFASNIALVVLFILFSPILCVLGLRDLARRWGSDE